MRPIWSSRCFAEEGLLRLSRRPAHWINRMFLWTSGTMLRRLRREKVRAWSSLIVVGGGVDGGGAYSNDEDEDGCR